MNSNSLRKLTRETFVAHGSEDLDCDAIFEKYSPYDYDLHDEAIDKEIKLLAASTVRQMTDQECLEYLRARFEDREYAYTLLGHRSRIPKLLYP
jgi:hypothetical protein